MKNHDEISIVFILSLKNHSNRENQVYNVGQVDRVDRHCAESS